MRTMPLALAGIAGTVVAACTAYGAPGVAPYRSAAADGRACFYAPHVRGFRNGPNDSIIVNSSSRDYFMLQPYHRCGNMNLSLSVGIRPRGSGYICEGYDADIYYRGVQGLEYCPVRAIRRLTPAEITAVRAGTFK